jgi:hypothetical protein
MLQKNQRSMQRSSTIEYEDDDNQGKLFYKTSVILNLINMFVLGFGLALFVVGILYLTVYRYEYSFTIFSIDMMAGIFLASGIIMILFSIFAVFLIKPYEQPHLVIIYSGVTFVLFLLLFLLGVIGISMNANGEFDDQIKDNMQYVANRYDLNNQYRHESRKMDWVQQRFKCCGINGVNDWRFLLTNRYGNSAGNVNNVPYRYDQYQNQGAGFNQPRSDVPDSCCMLMAPSCGRQLNLIGSRDQQGAVVFIEGCFNAYSDYFSDDIIFICTLSLVISIGLLFISAILVFSFTLIRKNYEILIRSTK